MCLECADNVTISPTKTCVKNNTEFTCSATHGHPGSPMYSWKNMNTGMISMSPTYMLNGVGFYTLTCNATYYAHPYCPEHWAACYANTTVRILRQYSLFLSQHFIFSILWNSILFH